MLGESSFVLFTSSTLSGMGIFKTFLLLSNGYDSSSLANFKVMEYLEASALQSSSQLQVGMSWQFLTVGSMLEGVEQPTADEWVKRMHFNGTRAAVPGKCKDGQVVIHLFEIQGIKNVTVFMIQ
jgi:hypothetical protein